jgi:predicted nucleic acid-binding protein
MIVVYDTTPLHYLELVESADILPALFQQVYVPTAVIEELAHSSAPPAVRAWIGSPPRWLLVRTPKHIIPSLKLDRGETHAISLAEELRANHLLIDEWAGRAVAASRGLHVIGTLGVLDQAAERNLVDLRKTFDRLLQTNFRVDRRLVDQLLECDAKRRP